LRDSHFDHRLLITESEDRAGHDYNYADQRSDNPENFAGLAAFALALINPQGTQVVFWRIFKSCHGDPFS
jgi:hypothetical protein